MPYTLLFPPHMFYPCPHIFIIPCLGYPFAYKCCALYLTYLLSILPIFNLPLFSRIHALPQYLSCSIPCRDKGAPCKETGSLSIQGTPCQAKGSRGPICHQPKGAHWQAKGLLLSGLSSPDRQDGPVVRSGVLFQARSLSSYTEWTFC